MTTLIGPGLTVYYLLVWFLSRDCILASFLPLGLAPSNCHLDVGRILARVIKIILPFYMPLALSMCLKWVSVTFSVKTRKNLVLCQARKFDVTHSAKSTNVVFFKVAICQNRKLAFVLTLEIVLTSSGGKQIIYRVTKFLWFGNKVRSSVKMVNNSKIIAKMPLFPQSHCFKQLPQISINTFLLGFQLFSSTVDSTVNSTVLSVLQFRNSKHFLRLFPI